MKYNLKDYKNIVGTFMVSRCVEKSGVLYPQETIEQVFFKVEDAIRVWKKLPNKQSWFIFGITGIKEISELIVK